MKIKRNTDINVKKIVENSVAGDVDFHFYVDELNPDNTMPTYSGLADEKYSFEEMSDGFFEFLNRRVNRDGIYIRLVYVSSHRKSDEIIFEIEYGGKKEEFAVKDCDKVQEFDFADYGIKIRGDEVTFGATIDGGCEHGVYFAEFGSDKANKTFISTENPLNIKIFEIMEKMIDF